MMAGSRSSSLRTFLLTGLSLASILLAVATLACADKPAASDADQRAQEEFFETKVRPVLFNRCLDCHGSEKSKAGLRLDSREAVLKGAESGPVVVPGKPGESPLIAAIRYEGDVQMPPKGKLKDEEIAALTEWVKRGAIWPAAPRSATGPAATSPARIIRVLTRIGPEHHYGATVILVVSAVARPGATGGEGRRVACFADRPVHTRQARGKPPGAGTCGG